MTKSSKTGYVKNVANLNELILFAINCGSDFKPVSPNISIKALQDLSAKAQNAIDEVEVVLTAYNVATIARKTAFMPLSTYATRILNMFRVNVPNKRDISHVKSIVFKIQGKRITPRKTKEEKEALEAKGIFIKEISTSQMKYTERASNLYKLIQTLGTFPQYNPNEPELKISNITAIYNDLIAKNQNAMNASGKLYTARSLRNEVICAKKTGLVSRGLDKKAYIKSVYGTKSPQYKDIAKLYFKLITN